MNYYFALLSVLAAFFSTTTLWLLVIGGVILGAVNFVFMRWALKQLRVEPGEDSDAASGGNASNAIGDSSIRTTVGVPRNRSLRPRDPAVERAELVTTSKTAGMDDEASRGDYAGARTSTNLDSESARGGKLASYEPIMPFAPGLAHGSALTGANTPVSASAETTRPDLVKLPVASSASPLVPPVTIAPDTALILTPLRSDEPKIIASKLSEPAKPLLPVEPLVSTPARLSSIPGIIPQSPIIEPRPPANTPADAGLIPVDKNFGEADAMLGTGPATGLVPSSTAEVALPKGADVPSGDRALNESQPSLAHLVVLSPEPAAESKSEPASMPSPEPLPTQTTEDEVKKSKSRQPSTSSPEGALIAQSSQPTDAIGSKSVDELGTPEMTGLILPALIPAQEVEVKPFVEPPAAKASESIAEGAPALPPLESAPHSAPEEQVKAPSRSRVFLPANLENILPTVPIAPVSLPVETPAASSAASNEASVAVPMAVPVTDQTSDTPHDRELEIVHPQMTSAVPLAAVEPPVEVHQPPASIQPMIEVESLPLPTAHAEEEKQEILQSIANEPAAMGSVTSLHGQAAEVHSQAPSVSEEQHSPSSLVPPPGAPLESAPHVPKAEPDGSMPPPLPLGLVEDIGHLNTPPPESPEHVVEPPLLTDASSEAHSPLFTSPIIESEPAHTDETTKPAPEMQDDSHTFKPEPNQGLSLVDAEHIHGVTIEPQGIHDDSPHDLPVQLAPVELVVEPAAEPVVLPVMEEKVFDHELQPPVLDLPVHPESSEPAPAPAPAPAVETETVSPASESLTIVPTQAAVAPAEDAPTTTPRSHMTSTDSTSSLPSGGRASAQLTLGFEVTSLQLTPFFKLGAVQLRSLSNVVSLHLLTTQQAENPLAAGISFQIETVELNESAHIRSILLKPLPQSQPTATPQPKLQVDNVQLGQGSEGAPIQVTSSQGTSTAVQLLATCTVVGMDFTPAFEIGSLRLEPTSNFVMLRSAPSQRPAALDLPPSFEVASVQLEGSAQIASVRLTPSTGK